MNPRQQLLLRKIKERNGSFPSAPNPMLRDAARFLAFTPERSLSQIRAMTIYESAKLMPLAFDPDSLLAGEHFNHFFGDDRDGGDEEKQRQLDELGDFRLAELRETARQLRSCRSAVSPGESTPESRTGMAGGWPALPAGTGGAAPVFTAVGWIENHSVRDYGFLLKHGFGGSGAWPNGSSNVFRSTVATMSAARTSCAPPCGLRCGTPVRTPPRRACPPGRSCRNRPELPRGRNRREKLSAGGPAALARPPDRLRGRRHQRELDRTARPAAPALLRT